MLHIFINKKNKLAAGIIAAVVLGAGLLAWYFVRDTGAPETLINSNWVWQRTESSDGSVLNAPGNELFVLEFGADGNLSSTTDCNSLFGEYKISGDEIKVGALAMTKKFCAGPTLEKQYSEQLQGVSRYLILGENLLQLEISENGGSMFFFRGEE